MSYKDKTYIIFDGDNDIWAYGRMKGWKALKNIDFDFENAHDAYPLTDRANDENYIKAILRKRFATAAQVVVLIGEKTKNLYKYVRWELEVAQELGLPIIAVNLNGKRNQDSQLCPAIIKDEYVVHIPFKLQIIKYALNNFPTFFKKREKTAIGPLYYPESVYENLDLTD